MEQTAGLDQLREFGRMRWLEAAHGWRAEPDEVVGALAAEGFDEYKREEARGRRGAAASGGVWLGINSRTGTVASTIWVREPDTGDVLVFVEIDGKPVRGT